MTTIESRVSGGRPPAEPVGGWSRVSGQDRGLAMAKPPERLARPETRDPRPGPCYEPFDLDDARALVRDVWAPVSEHWFRPKLVGAEKIPAQGPLILASNHSGTAFPYDAMVLDAHLWWRDGMTRASKLRTVFEYGLTLKWWMRPFGVANFWRRCGGVDMTFDNFERLLQRGDRVLYYPEGVPGIGKGFLRRYQLQRFSSSFVLLAARHGVPVLPVYTINAEWVDPLGVPFRWLDRVMQVVFGVPFLPIPIGLLGVVLPWAWFLALPARMVFVVGEPIDVAGMMREAGVTDLAQPDRAALRAVADRVRMQMQGELDAHVETHGQRPYDFRSLFRHLRREWKHILHLLPPGWPTRFILHDRNRQRPPARNRLHAILRDLDLAAFQLPLGWPLLTLSRRLRRPPYGYRGVPAAERKERDGEFVWRLSERPLPPRDDPEWLGGQ